MAVKEKKKEQRGEDALNKLDEHQKDWETEESLQEFLKFVRGEDKPDSLKKIARRDIEKP